MYLCLYIFVCKYIENFTIFAFKKSINNTTVQNTYQTKNAHTQIRNI